MKRLKIRAIRRLFARHRFLVYAEAAFFWLLAIAAFYWMIGYFIVPSIAESMIERLSGGAATVQSGHFKGLNGVHLNGVVLGTDADDLQDAPIFRADTIEIRFNPLRLLRGRFSVGSIKLLDFLVTVDYNPDQKHWNFSDFSPASADTTNLSKIPLILLERGAVQLRTIKDQAYQVVTTITVNGTIAEKTGKNEYGFSLETDGRFGYGPSRLQGGLRLGENDAENSFWLAGNVQTPERGVFQNQWNLRDIKLECLFDAQSFNIQTCEFLLGSGRGEVSGLVHLDDQRGFALDMKLHQFELAEYLKPDAVVYIQLQDYVAPGLRDFLARYHPAGIADVDMQFNGSLRSLDEANLNGRIHCTDITICDNKFPYQFNHLQGDIEFSGRSLRLAELQSRHNDVKIQIDGTVKNFGPNPAIVMNVVSPNMQLDADLYHAIAAPQRDPNGDEAQMWHDISPTGITEFDYHFEQTSDGEKSQTITLRLIDVSAMYKGFPYPLRQLTGTVIIEPNRLQLKDIVSKYEDGSRIVINGQLDDINGPQADFKITCRGVQVPVDQTLIEAFPPRQRSFFDHLSIEAVTDFVVDIVPDSADRSQTAFNAKIEVEGPTLDLHDFPLEATDIKASVVATGDLLQINRFEGLTESGYVRLLDDSKIWPQGKDPNRLGYSLLLDVDHFQLNDAFWQAVGPDAEKSLGKLRLSGAIDANGLLEANLDDIRAQGTNLTIHCQDNPIQWDAVALGQVDGQLTVRGQDVMFQDFTVRDLPLESFPQALMSDKVKTIHTELTPKGTIEMRIRRGMVQMGPQGPTLIDAGVLLQTQQLFIGQTDPPHRLKGNCEGHFVFDLPSDRWQMTAHYDIDHFDYLNWQVTDLTGDLAHDPNTHLLQSNDFKAQFYDGQMTGSGEMSLGDQASYTLDLNFTALNLAKLPPLGNKVQWPSAKAGTADGRVILTGPLDALSNPRGKFGATIANLEMGRQSLLGKILTAVQFKQPEEYIFHGIELNAEILGPELIFDRIRIIGSPLVFDGMGTMNLKTRMVAFNLSVWDRIVTDRQSIFDMLARGLGSALWKVEVQGSMDDPKVNAVYLSILKQPLDLFKNNE